MTEKKAEYETENPVVKEAREVREAQEARHEQPKTLEQMTLSELKALTYDVLVQIQQGQNNLNVIQAEIQKRGQVPGS
jgi:sRNA-binding protein